MSRLFFELYLDSDPAHLAYATDQRKTLLTHNRSDFEELAQQYFTAGIAHYGIILAVRRSPYEIARRVMLLLNQLTADEMENRVRYI